jgi:outer membrane beta-barrel protein
MKPWYTSPMGRLLIVMVILALWALTSTAARADVIEFPEEELSRESVLPVFDQPEAVKKRFVPTEGRIEVEAFAGASLNDPFLNNYPVGLSASYHLNELFAIGALGGFFSNSQSGYVSQIQQLNEGGTIPFNNNPTPSWMGLGEFEFTPYYGKISLTKQTILNLNISATARLGMIGFSGGGSNMAGGLGLNERLFFSRNFGIKFDLSALIYSKGDVIPFQSGVSNQVVAQTTAVNLYMFVGALWYFPSL